MASFTQGQGHKTESNSLQRLHSPEPVFPDFEPEHSDDFPAHGETWKGDPDRPKTPESADFDLSDSEEEYPVKRIENKSHREDQAQRWLSQRKWGLIIYRCTYGNDKKWAEFMEVLEAMGRCHTVEDPELDATLAFDVREDEALVKSNDLSGVRHHFENWIHSDEIKSEMREGKYENIDEDADLLHRIHNVQMNKSKPVHLSCPRYSYFIYVDDEAMESVLAHKENSKWWQSNYCGWVNVVDIALPVGPISVRPVTPSQLYPEYYKILCGGDPWEHRPKPPLVDTGDFWGYWPDHGSERTLSNGEKDELWAIQQRLDENNDSNSSADFEE